jgi:hypothetical protein
MNYKDNVKETTTVTSTASFTPGGAAANYQAFTSAYADGTARIPIKVGPDSAGAWEVGYYTLSGGVLTRNGLISSSNGGSAVTFASGSKDVTVVYPAAYAVDTENTATLTNKRVSPRILTLGTFSATPTINTDSYDEVILNPVSNNISSMTTNLTGTPNHGEQITFHFKPTANATIGWGTKFEDSSIAKPTNLTSGVQMSVTFTWNSLDSMWRCVGYA